MTPCGRWWIWWDWDRSLCIRIWCRCISGLSLWLGPSPLVHLWSYPCRCCVVLQTFCPTHLLGLRIYGNSSQSVLLKPLRRFQWLFCGTGILLEYLWLWLHDKSKTQIIYDHNSLTAMYALMDEHLAIDGLTRGYTLSFHASVSSKS